MLVLLEYGGVKCVTGFGTSCWIKFKGQVSTGGASEGLGVLEAGYGQSFPMARCWVFVVSCIWVWLKIKRGGGLRRFWSMVPLAGATQFGIPVF